MQHMQEMQVWSLDGEDPLEEAMTTHFSILAWKISWTEESGGLQSIGLQRVGQDWMTEHTYISLGILLQHVNMHRLFLSVYKIFTRTDNTLSNKANHNKFKIIEFYRTKLEINTKFTIFKTPDTLHLGIHF